jgi:hypothetical protein
MTIYTYSEARQNLASILEEARTEGEVRIKRRDGQEFVVKPARANGSPFNVKGVKSDISADEIVDAVRESRAR